MIAKGNPHGNGAKLARYLMTGCRGERAELVELRGLAGDDIHAAFATVALHAATTCCRKPFFHAYVRLPAGERLHREQWRAVADRIERQLGFGGQGRAIAFHHQPAGDTHMHVAWSRIDLEQRRARDPGLYKNKLKEISRRLECELGLARVSSEPPAGRKTRAPGRKEFEQARRLGTDLVQIREAIRASWDLAHDGRSFMAALAMHGLVLARGDRRDFVAVDRAGGEHALSKRITGATAAATRARLADLDAAKLPSVAQAKIRDADPVQAGAAALSVSSENDMRAPAAERGIAEYPAPANNASAAITTRPIIAPGLKSAPEPENAGCADPDRAGCNGAQPLAEHVLCNNTPLAHSPNGPKRAERLSLFRRAARALSRRAAPSPEKSRRRRSGEAAGSAFRKTATRIAIRVPAAYAAAGAFLSDTLDWLNLWHDNEAGLDDGFEQPSPNHLFPHL